MGVEPFPISGLLLRRAVLGTLLAAGCPMSPAEIAAALAAAGATTSPERTKGPSRLIADLLAYQVRLGKVVKLGPALFAVVPERISRSTRQRCLGWRRQLEQRVADDEAWLAEHPEDAEDTGEAEPTPATVCPSPPPSDALAFRVETSERGGLGETSSGCRPAEPGSARALTL